ncbi:MAG: mismatch-specific DNA-glycosylase, partial [Bacillota bacterium]
MMLKGELVLGPIPDYLRLGLDILFVGYNPSILSGKSGHHYANPRNRFWQILNEAGLTPRKYRPEEDQYLLELGYGLTNIVARPTRSAAEITREEYAQGRQLLAQ